MERCGHVDFYMNGGIIQPGCDSSSGSNPFACSHHRAPEYYMESIRSFSGFWGWACESYIYYLLGFCPPKNPLIMAGEDCRTDMRGIYLITTNSKNPFAMGKWQDIVQDSPADVRSLFSSFKSGSDRNPFDMEIDKWGKLQYEFNDIQLYHHQESVSSSNHNRIRHAKPVNKNISNNIIPKAKTHNFIDEHKYNNSKAQKLFQVPVVKMKG